MFGMRPVPVGFELTIGFIAVGLNTVPGPVVVIVADVPVAVGVTVTGVNGLSAGKPVEPASHTTPGTPTVPNTTGDDVVFCCNTTVVPGVCTAVPPGDPAVPTSPSWIFVCVVAPVPADTFVCEPAWPFCGIAVPVLVVPVVPFAAPVPFAFCAVPKVPVVCTDVASLRKNHHHRSATRSTIASATRII
jgi:hypothetical protein